MKIFILIVAFILLPGLKLFPAERLAQLQDTFKRPFFLMDEHHICIGDKGLNRFYIYSKENLKKISSFGDSGEGPGEWLVFNEVTLKNDCVFVSHFPKLSVFSINGKLKAELKGHDDSSNFIPLGPNYVGTRILPGNRLSEKDTIIFTLFDSNLEKIKDIISIEFTKFARFSNGKWITLWVRDCMKAVVYDNILYIGNTGKGFFFAVFDKNGDKLYEINNTYEKERITGEYKRWRLESFRKLAGEKRWNLHKDNTILFPEYFPAYINFSVDNGKIYAFMYPHPGENDQEIIILNIKGEFLGRKTIPLIGFGIYEADKLCIREGKLYFLHDNDETEKWEICFENIDGLEPRR